MIRNAAVTSPRVKVPMIGMRYTSSSECKILVSQTIRQSPQTAALLLRQFGPSPLSWHHAHLTRLPTAATHLGRRAREVTHNTPIKNNTATPALVAFVIFSLQITHWGRASIVTSEMMLITEATRFITFISIWQ